MSFNDDGTAPMASLHQAHLRKSAPFVITEGVGQQFLKSEDLIERLLNIAADRNNPRGIKNADFPQVAREIAEQVRRWYANLRP